MFGVYEPATVPASAVPQEVTILGGETRRIDSVVPGVDTNVSPTRPGRGLPRRPTSAVPIGRLVGARSGDKGGHANLGVFVRDDAAWAWLDDFLTTDRLRDLLPETASFAIDRHRF